MSTISEIQNWINEAFSPTYLDIVDESHLHAGHYHQESSDPSHLKIIIHSAAFSGLSKVKQHQLVNKVLKPAFDDGLHALALTTASPH